MERLLCGREHATAIVAKLEATLRKAITDSGVSEKLKDMAVNPGGGSSAEFRKMIDADIENYVAGHQGREPEIRQLTALLHSSAGQSEPHRNMCGISARCPFSAAATALYKVWH